MNYSKKKLVVLTTSFFSLQFTVKHCDNVLNSSNAKTGTIKSPLFPGTYPQKTLCRYEFQGKERERVQVRKNYILSIKLK